jgi:hypothetical protein
LLSWIQHRRIVALGVLGFGFITASVATTLIIIARGSIPDFWSIIVGNALLAAAYGILWCGARKLDGKKVSILLALTGVLACALARTWRWRMALANHAAASRPCRFNSSAASEVKSSRAVSRYLTTPPLILPGS